MSARDDYPWLEYFDDDPPEARRQKIAALDEIDRLRDRAFRYTAVIAKAEGVIAMHLPKWQSEAHIERLKETDMWEDWMSWPS